jgi:hypothetical protein
MGPMVERMVCRVLRMELCRGGVAELAREKVIAAVVAAFLAVAASWAVEKMGRRCLPWKRRVQMSFGKRAWG